MKLAVPIPYVRPAEGPRVRLFCAGGAAEEMFRVVRLKKKAPVCAGAEHCEGPIGSR